MRTVGTYVSRASFRLAAEQELDLVEIAQMLIHLFVK